MSSASSLVSLFTILVLRHIHKRGQRGVTFATTTKEPLELFNRYSPIELAVAENTLLALPPTNRSVPTTNTKMTASITAYFSDILPLFLRVELAHKSVMFAPPRDSIRYLNVPLSSSSPHFSGTRREPELW
jgi:hypothetical protein